MCVCLCVCVVGSREREREIVHLSVFVCLYECVSSARRGRGSSLSARKSGWKLLGLWKSERPH